MFILLHLTIKYCCTLRHAFNGNNFQDILKGRICTETNMSTIIMDENTQDNFSTKQILMILFCSSILLGFTYFYFFSALKQRSHYFK